jgi:hypothetical protein
MTTEITFICGTGLPLREPEASCEGCGAVGTVGRAIRNAQDGAVLEMHRSCARCWPEESARYEARWREEDRLATDAWLRGEPGAEPATRGMTFESATWHATLELLADARREMHRGQRGDAAPGAADLTRLAQQIRQQASEREGPMPMEIELFLQEYDPPVG